MLGPSTPDSLVSLWPGGPVLHGCHSLQEIRRSNSFALHLFLLISFLIYQTAANYIVSQLAVWEINFPGGISNDNIKWRALIWAISEGLLFVSVAINYLPPRLYSAVFRFSIFIIMLDFFLCLIWLPIGVSKTYGFRSAKDVFTMSCMSSSGTLS